MSIRQCSGDGNLFDGKNVDGPNVRLFCEELGSDLAERRRDLTVDVCLAGILRVEGVEDAVAGVTQFEGVPGHGSLFGHSESSATFQEGGEVLAFAGLGFEKGEQSEFDGHDGSPFVWVLQWIGWALSFGAGALKVILDTVLIRFMPLS
jgi:hypothetical protein